MKDNLIDKKLNNQKEKYKKQAEDYVKEHDSYYAQQYRDLFIRERLFSFDLSGKKILDAMCAYGTETGYLIARGGYVIGLDISEENANLYRKIWNLPCEKASIHEMPFPDNSFDVVYIFGGLHHVLFLLDEVMKEVYRVLKPGGLFCFVEPNKDTWLNYLRNIWYALDKKFTPEEEAISYPKTLTPFLSLGYKEISISYAGGLAYLIFSQSLVLKTPSFLKKILWPPLCFIEKVMERALLNPKLFFAAKWEKEKN